MQTRVLKGNKAIEEAKKLLDNNQIVAFPTETVYGLGGNAFSKEVVYKIFEAKNRPQDNPLIVHTYAKNQIPKIAAYVGKNAKKIINAFMPGPLTIVLKKSDNIPYEVTAGLDSVGIRIPENKTARKLLRKIGYPLAAPSANLSTKISPTSAEHVFNDLNGRIPLIIDGGESIVGIESTVLDMSNDTPIILRPGIITEEMINNVINGVKQYKGEIKSVPSPGMRYKHYAPQVETVCVNSKEVAIRLINEKSCKITLIGTSDFVKDIKGVNIIDIGNTDSEIARNIYKALHNAEKVSDFIMVEYFKGSQIKDSVMNRVIKAASHTIIE